MFHCFDKNSSKEKTNKNDNQSVRHVQGGAAKRAKHLLILWQHL